MPRQLAKRSKNAIKDQNFVNSTCKRWYRSISFHLTIDQGFLIWEITGSIFQTYTCFLCFSYNILSGVNRLCHIQQINTLLLLNAGEFDINQQMK